MDIPSIMVNIVNWVGLPKKFPLIHGFKTSDTFAVFNIPEAVPIPNSFWNK